jgi:8-hydroxy-5-deazaflavin:NADPH oxidoreductase
MKVAVLGGTGKMGSGVARHLARTHEVIIGSRDPAKARAAASGVKGASGAGYAQAAREAEVVVVSVPYSALGTMAAVANEVEGKLVVSMVNPMKTEGGLRKFAPEEGSAAEELAKMLPGARVATAFNNVPVAFFDGEEVPTVDVLVAADSRETYEEAAALVRSIPDMRPLYAGPLSEARTIERITPLVLNLARLNETGSLTTKFVSKKR